MTPLVIAAITLTIAFGAALLGGALRKVLPDHHFATDSKDVVKLVMGLLSTMAALVVGLLLASAQTSYSAQNSNLQTLAANILEIDRVLGMFGSETQDARLLLKNVVAGVHDRVWLSDGMKVEQLNPRDLQLQADAFFDAVQKLTPRNETQKFAQSQAIQLSAAVGQARLLLFEQGKNSLPWPFLVVLLAWIGMLFIGFGLLAPLHSTVTAVLMIGALTVSSGIFLILELGEPYSGFIQLSDTPLREAITQIGQSSR